MGSLKQILKRHRDYRLICWNRNCDIPIWFETPVCRMKDGLSNCDRVEAHFTLVIFRGYTAQKFTKILHREAETLPCYRFKAA